MKDAFKCAEKNCEDSCCGNYEGFAESLYSVDGRNFTDIILTDDEASALLGSQYASFLYKDDDLFKIRTDEKGYCSAYCGGKCIIQDYKPSVCKCYPLYLDVMVGLCAHKSCPSVKAHNKLSYYEEELPYLLKICKFWISYYERKLCKSSDI